MFAWHLAAGWLAVALHVVLFSFIARLWTRPAPAGGWPFAAATAIASALSLPVCALDSEACATLDTLSVSRVLAGTPWCAVLAVLLMVAAASARSALLLAGAPLCATASFASIAALAASPDVGGSLSILHDVSLACCACSSFAFVTLGISATRSGRGRVALARAHIAASMAWGAVGIACVWATNPGRHIRMLGILSEMATLLHVAASVA